MVLQNTYDAICDPSGLYDFVLPSLAILSGAKRIYVRPGTYNESKSISVPNGTTIIGAQVDTTIIDFGSNSASLISDSGYGTAVANGTISVTQGSPTVVGTGTTFLTSLLTSGQYIMIDKNAFLISAVIDNTHITLAYPFRGRTRSGLAYKALAMFSGLEVTNLTIRNSTSAGLRLSGNRRARVANLAIRNCATNVVMNDCAECSVKTVNASYSAGVGLSVADCDSCNVKDLFLINNASDGMLVTGVCSGLRLRSVDAANNGGNGVNLNGTNITNLVVSDSTLVANVQNGLLSNANSANVTAVGTHYENNGVAGASYAGANGRFTACTFSLNVNVGLELLGDDCVVQGCMGMGDLTNQPIGVQFSGARGVMTGSTFTNCSANGVYITSSASTVLIATNNVSGAGIKPIQDDSPDSYAGLNMM